MKPLSIADYLDHLGRAAGEKPPPRENSPFRPRSLPSPQSRRARFEAGLRSHGERGRRNARGRGSPAHALGAKASSAEFGAAAAAGGEPVKPEDMSVKLAEAYARGREEGLAEGRTEASDRHAAELAAAREQAETQQAGVPSQRIRGARRRDPVRVPGDRGQCRGAVTRILAPFLSQQVVKRAVDDLAKAIARLCAGDSPGLIKIRGPERMLALLRQRIADLPIEVEYVEDDRVETVVEANATQIVAELRPWAELLASFEA